MPNHFHLIVHVKRKIIKKAKRKKKNLNGAIGVLLRSYTRALQKQEGFTGSLFQQRTKAKELSKETDFQNINLQACGSYVHNNPLKAGLVKELQDWPYSSHTEYQKNVIDPICDKELFYRLAGEIIYPTTQVIG